MIDYKEKAREVHGCGKRICMGCAVIEAALKSAAADAYRDAVNVAWTCDTGMPSASLVVALKAKAAALSPGKEG